jgi:hypothetical protein
MINGDHALELVTMSMNVQSVVSPVVTNGATHVVAKSKAKRTTAIPATAMTATQACEIAFNYGDNLAGLDGGLTKALVAFKDDEAVQKDMLQELSTGYMMKKLGYTRDQATKAIGKLHHSDKPDKQDDNHRTFDEQRVMDTIRVLWHRAKKNAGILAPKSEAQVKAEAARAEKEAQKKILEAKREEAWKIVHPKDDVDPFDSLARLVLTMKALQKKHADKLVGDRGTAWRDWLASAPK